MSRDELWDKFEDCAGRALPKDRIMPLFEMLENFESVTAVADLTAAIALEPAAAATGREKIG